MKKTATAVIIGSLAVTLVACGPSEEFKKACKNAGGQVKLESEVGSIFSMEAVSFVAGGKGRGRNGSSSSSDDDYVCVQGDKILFEED